MEKWSRPELWVRRGMRKETPWGRNKWHRTMRETVFLPPPAIPVGTNVQGNQWNSALAARSKPTVRLGWQKEWKLSIWSLVSGVFPPISYLAHALFSLYIFFPCEICEVFWIKRTGCDSQSDLQGATARSARRSCTHPVIGQARKAPPKNIRTKRRSTATL